MLLAHETQSAEAGEMMEWRCAIQQSLTVTVHIPVHNVVVKGDDVDMKIAVK